MAIDRHELRKEAREIENEMKERGTYRYFYNEYSDGYWNQEYNINSKAAENLERKQAIETLRRLGPE